jgi:hypothetical protein
LVGVAILTILPVSPKIRNDVRVVSSAALSSVYTIASLSSPSRVVVLLGVFVNIGAVRDKTRTRINDF